MARDHIFIERDAISGILETRWIACYMLYDWNIRHAAFAFSNNEGARIREVAEPLGNDFKHNDEEPQNPTKKYNEVLAQEVEAFIQSHMRDLNCSRTHVELEIARVMAEVLDKEQRR